MSDDTWITLVPNAGGDLPIGNNGDAIPWKVAPIAGGNTKWLEETTRVKPATVGLYLVTANLQFHGDQGGDVCVVLAKQDNTALAQLRVKGYQHPAGSLTALVLLQPEEWISVRNFSPELKLLGAASTLVVARMLNPVKSAG